MSSGSDEAAIVGEHWQMEGLPDPPDLSVVGTPGRRPASIRRTAHINMTWPAGPGTPMQLQGRARDLLTTAGATPRVLAEAEMLVDAGNLRTITAISVRPDHENIISLVGARGGSRFRSAIDAALPGEREAATPLYFLLDDIAGATLIGGFAWSQHRPMIIPEGERSTGGATQFGRTRDGRVVCSGLRPGGYHQVSRERGVDLSHFLRLAGDLSAPKDSWAWHEIEPAPTVCMRRRRRLDVWWSGEQIAVDGHFRDSTWDRDHVELSLHEYTLQATIDPASHALRSIDTQARVLPFPECPWAAPHTVELVGMSVDGFRTSVQDTLTELHCCTHLNDMLRGLAEVPVLARSIEP
jgi:hypothetical protein